MSALLGTGTGRGTSDDFSMPFIVPEHRLIFCATPKVASEAWLRLLRRMAGFSNWRAGGVYFLDKFKRVGGLQQLRELPHTIALQHMRSEKWTRAVVVRDPAERLLSAYLDKIAQSRDSAPQLEKYSHDLFNLSVASFPNTSFHSFVDRALYGLSRGYRTDQHWWPQAANCALRSWLPAYNVVLQVDGQTPLPSLLACLLNETARHSQRPAMVSTLTDTFDLPPRPEVTTAGSGAGGSHATDAHAVLRRYYTPSLLRRVVNAYAEDYFLFQLPVPSL